MRPRPALSAAAALLALTVLAGCGTADPSASLPTGTKEGGDLVYATDREPTCLDPHNSGDMPQTYIARQYLDSLVSMKADGTVVPWLAQSWDVSKDGKTYDFHLKKGVEFTDGEPLDADAVVANFEQIMDPDTQSSTDLLYLSPYFEKATAVSEHTVRVTLKRPYSPLLTVLSQAFFGIESPRAMARGLEANCAAPVGTGPFKVAEWKRNQEVVLERNDDYDSAPADAKHQGPAYLEKVTWRFLKDNTARFGALQSGKAQAIFNLPPESVPAATADSRIDTDDFVHSGVPFALDFNTDSPQLSDVRVRRAIVHAADAPGIVESAYAGVFPYEGNALSSGTPDYDESYHEPFPYDPDKAAKLLDEAGWTGRDEDGYRTKDGKTLTLRLPYNSDPGETPPADLTIFQNFQAMEKRVGIKVELQPKDAASMTAIKTDPTAYDLQGRYWNSPTPGVMYIKFSKETLDIDNGQNVARDYDDELDKTLVEAAGTTDPEKQQQLYSTAQGILTSQAWHLPLYPVQTRLATRSDQVKDIWIEPSEGEPVLHDAYLIRDGA
ncbi:ABC transporter substrate-binding protein [Brachybacterium sp. MASK1Z-5]|uniref:ABC transporter substrate-binding protein n=1 Tax=Brachybacterium halotolerans TaxID=2795215 RepID=A0ABS1BDV2_9MICO|nr:ABC transporter substrate-binding protein [Brachybacterium halotolerans]MBK0332826.1 ABC transporter substrate-binding protein [Brachybacterium halotolerans]